MEERNHTISPGIVWLRRIYVQTSRCSTLCWQELCFGGFTKSCQSQPAAYLRMGLPSSAWLSIKSPGHRVFPLSSWVLFSVYSRGIVQYLFGCCGCSPCGQWLSITLYSVMGTHTLNAIFLLFIDSFDPSEIYWISHSTLEPESHIYFLPLFPCLFPIFWRRWVFETLSIYVALESASILSWSPICAQSSSATLMLGLHELGAIFSTCAKGTVHRKMSICMIFCLSSNK